MNFKLFNPAFYLGLIKEVLWFVMRPEPIGIKNTVSEKLQAVAALFFISLILNFILGVFISKLNTGQHMVNNLFTELPFYLILFLGGIIAPVIEELAFRLSIRFTPVYFAISLTMVLYFIISIFEKNIVWILYILPIIGGLIIFAVSNKYKDLITSFWKKKFRIIFYFSCILFSFLHITNYEITTRNLLLLPLLTLPQLVSGIILGFIRIRYGFLYNCLMHCSFNLLLLSLLIGSHQITEF